MTHVYDKFPLLQGKDPDTRARRYLTPVRILWSSAEDGADISGTDALLRAREEQISFGNIPFCRLKNVPGQPKASILLDYGTELNGTVRLMIREVRSPQGNRANLRVRFGESAMEAMTDFGVKNTTNDHANRDMVINVGFFSANETNESGFRFVRIDLLDDEAEVLFKSINATFIFRDLDYLGNFECSDAVLNKIWHTAAYTAHLNMQEYLWDGIKRDRLVWIGDMHTEIMTILSVFGANEVIPKSLDLARDDAPIGENGIVWMNGIPAYSLWWILNQYEWYKGVGDEVYLSEQKEYMTKLLAHLVTLVDENGVEQLPMKFLDWPNNANDEAKHAGMQGLLKMALERGAEMIERLGNTALAADCRAAAAKMQRYCPADGGSKSAGALLVLTGLKDAAEENSNLLAVNGAHGFSTFLGYYILQAKAMAGDWQGALDAMRQYWGGMLKMGATSFWEDFDLNWMENAAPIDELVPEGKIDIHGDWGAYCYVKFRHSLCHGWASGPCPFMMHYVLGIQVEAAGSKKIRIEPHLGDLDYAKGTFPTPFGLLTVSHKKNADGSIATEINAPDSLEIV